MTKAVSDNIEVVPADRIATRLLTAAEVQGLAEVTPEVEWFANIINPHTRRAYMNDVKDFMAFVDQRREAAVRRSKRRQTPPALVRR